VVKDKARLSQTQSRPESTMGEIDHSRERMEICDKVVMEFVWCSVVLVEEEREDCLRSNAYGVSNRLADP
jgi:hypothetical protein